jgi:predicted branched-subunit amino acid permease
MWAVPSNVPNAAPGSSRERLVAGVRVGVGLAAGSFLLAVAFGALARSAGWGIAAPIVASLVVFSGSAQFALAANIGHGLVPAVTAAALINARFLPMALAAGPSLRGGRVRKALEGQAVVDASWALAHLGGGRFDRERLIGATLPQWPAWVAGTALGVFAAPSQSLTTSIGLDAIFPAFFLLLLLDELRMSARNRVAAASSAVLTALLAAVLPAGFVVPLTTFAIVATMLALSAMRQPA